MFKIPSISVQCPVADVNNWLGIGGEDSDGSIDMDEGVAPGRDEVQIETILLERLRRVWKDA